MIESTTTTDSPLSDTIHKYTAQTDECVRRHPASAVLFALGAGLLIGLIVRGLRPDPTPRQRLTRLLEEFESRLRGVVEPAVEKAGALAHEGVDALQHGEARVEQLVRGAGQRVRKLFS